MFSEDCSSGLMVHIFFPVKHWKPANYGGCAANTSATAENRQPLLVLTPEEKQEQEMKEEESTDPGFS